MLTNGYVTLEQFASMLGGSTTNLIVEFAEECIETASRDIDNYCSRRFYREATVASARTFPSISPLEVFIDDCYEAPTVVAIDSAGDGTFATTWTAANYEVQPAIIDGVAPADRPYGRILTVAGNQFPLIPRNDNVRVTAKWGWAAVPTPVRSACRRLAHLQYEARNAAFGAAGTAETGYIRLRDDVLACQWLDPYVKNTPKFLVA